MAKTKMGIMRAGTGRRKDSELTTKIVTQKHANPRKLPASHVIVIPLTGEHAHFTVNRGHRYDKLLRIIEPKSPIVPLWFPTHSWVIQADQLILNAPPKGATEP
jgi:hypothetical protein